MKYDKDQFGLALQRVALKPDNRLEKVTSGFGLPWRDIDKSEIIETGEAWLIKSSSQIISSLAFWFCESSH